MIAQMTPMPEQRPAIDIIPKTSEAVASGKSTG
jgi:hypothetical protein